MELSRSRWLLTGANGRIGSHLRPYLRERVAHLVVADLECPSGIETNETGAAFDLDDAESIRSLLEGCDGVVHLAGIPDEAPFPDLLRINALGTYNLLEAMRLNGVTRLVNASSNRSTGFYPTTEILDDTTPPRPDGLYGASKVAVEAVTRLYADKFDFQVSNIRIGSFEEAPTSPREAATWLSSADACRAFEAAMRTEERYCVFYAVSANKHRFWSLEPGRRIGFYPQDDASTHLGSTVTAPAGPQAGDMASAEYTLRAIDREG